MTLYEPAEDSELLAQEVKKLAKNKTVLDMGTGSGIQALTALKAGATSVTATDINKEAKTKLPKEIKFIHSDLFDNIKNSYDLILFNPPYLPEDLREPPSSKQATTGGPKGDELILKFLKQALNHLNKNGAILLLLSSLTPQRQIEEVLSSFRFRKTTLSTKKLFMEELQVWKIEKV
ncbi:hypothetical protein CMI48_01695 [Candidatus Pacearchaeota archaeon]|jgi:release factor glutamine methyltransferase|nr:hypothetical protein [Candidatus Pacearchaeota archaeon]